MGKIISFDFNDAKPQRSSEENKTPPDIAFRDFIQECGFNRPESIIEDGEIHRYGKNMWTGTCIIHTNPTLPGHLAAGNLWKKT